MEIRAAGAALLVVLAVGGCDSSQRERVEAQRLIAAYEHLTAAVRSADRETQLESLRTLPLRHEAPSKARDLCVEAHTALLSAEQAQDRAGAMLEQAIAGKGADPLDPTEIAPIQATLDRSDADLKSAKASFVKCEDAVRDLALRYGQRR